MRLRPSVALVALLACSRPPLPDPPEDRIDGATIVISTESARLGGPVDLAVDQSGLLYVLDYDAAQILIVSASGAAIRVIGRAGSGPGEFQRPGSFSLAHDSLRVVDQGNGRLQTLALPGPFTRSVLLPPVSTMGPVAVGDDGGFLVTTLGMHGALAAYYDPSGMEQVRLGTPPDSGPPALNPRQSKEALIAGRVPALFRNAVLPVIAPDRDLWLILTGEGQLERYSRDGTLKVSVPLRTPEMRLVRSEAVAYAKATLEDQRSVRPIRFVFDAAVVGHTLWLLLNTTADGPAVLLAIGPDGQVVRRLTFPAIHGARSFALDPARALVFFALPGSASVVSASLPRLAGL